MQKTIKKWGNEKIRPKLGSTVQFHYITKFKNKVVESTRTNKKPFSMVLGKTKMIWDRGCFKYIMYI
jgi:FKBP-type peptidyl-prolyl cis-trans isomerase